MRRTLLWAFGLLVLLGGFAWWQVNQLWARRDALFESGIRAAFQQNFPEWSIDFASARLMSGGQVVMRDLRIGIPGQADALLEITETRAQLDQELLHSNLQVFIKHIDVDHPKVNIARDAQGRWNIAQLPRIRASDAPLPSIQVIEGLIEVRLDASPEHPELALQLTPINGRWDATSYEKYRVLGTCGVESSGQIALDASIDVDTLDWELKGRCQDWPRSEPMLAFAAGLSPSVREQVLALIDQAQTAPQVAQHGVPVRTASLPGSGQFAGQHGGAWFELPALGIGANLQVAFELDGPDLKTLSNYQVAGHFEQGVVNHPAIPAPLENLRGDFFLDPSRCVLSNLQAANGTSELFVDGSLSHDPEFPARQFTIRARNLQFGRQIEPHLSGALKKACNFLQVAGQFNLDVTARTDGRNPWEIELKQFQAIDCFVQPQPFAYPFTQVGGQIRQEGNEFHVEMQASAQGRPVSLRGRLQQTAHGIASDLRLTFDGVPIDAAFLTALSTPELYKAHEVFEHLRLEGLLSGELTIEQTGIAGNRPVVGLDARLTNGAAAPRSFPLPLNNVSARVKFDPHALDPQLQDVWRITELQAQRGDAQLSGAASFDTRNHANLLQLELTVLGLPIDDSLRTAALAANPALQAVFESLAPGGTIDLEDARLVWSPGTAANVVLPRIAAKDARVQLAGWRFPWERVDCRLAWDGERLAIASLTGWHGSDTYLQIDSRGERDAAVLLLPTRGDLSWQCHLEDVKVRKLTVDQQLLDSLQGSALGRLLADLSLRGPVNLDVGFDLKGFKSRPDLITAAWNLHVELPDNHLRAGVDLQDVTGDVHITHGEWDGRRAIVDGFLMLDRATTLGTTFEKVEAPLYVDGDELFIGTPAWPEISRAPAHSSQLNPLAGKQARAEIYDGQLGFDLHARLPATDAQETNYRVSMGLLNARLETLARAQGLSADRLSGSVRAELDLVGQGSSDRKLRGTGWIQISPAQLYELPVLNRVMSTLEGSRPDRTAFNYAYGDYTLHDGYVDFSKIDLFGQSLRLVGKGTIAFGEGLNQQLMIDFYRSQFVNRLPLIGQAFSALTANSVGVQVRGTLNEPLFNSQTKLGVIDDTLRGMLDSFTPGQRPTLPRPTMGGAQGSPLVRPMQRFGQQPSPQQAQPLR
ncbi:MAG: AsmA-like C-terminal region-containing protein [Planctomycetaceae bacterium]